MTKMSDEAFASFQEFSTLVFDAAVEIDEGRTARVPLEVLVVQILEAIQTLSLATSGLEGLDRIEEHLLRKGQLPTPEALDTLRKIKQRTAEAAAQIAAFAFWGAYRASGNTIYTKDRE